MALDPTVVACPDGQRRRFHRSLSTALRGYVFIGRTRVYGNIHREQVGGPYVFVGDPSLQGGKYGPSFAQPA